MDKSEQFYYKRLLDYVEDNYWDVQADAEWFVNPAINQFKFRIPFQDTIILLTCSDNGDVTEKVVIA